MMALYCAVIGEDGSAFTVDIDPGQSVGDLKDMIKKKNKKMLRDVNAVELFLAKREREETGAVEDDEGGWLAQHGTVSDTNGFKHLLVPDEKLQDVGLDSGDLGEGHVHVLVRDRLVVSGVNIHVTKKTKLSPPALVAFWKAFQEDRTEIKADAVVALPEGTFLLGNSMHGSRIYIRHCYPHLWEACLAMIHNKVTQTPHLVILGNPGIGKTFFGYFVLLQLALLGETVVYESGRTRKRFLFSPDAVAEGSQEDFLFVFSNSPQHITLWTPSSQ